MSEPITLPLNPIPKPRMTRADRWKKRPATDRYWAFKDELNSLARGKLDPRFDIEFHVPMPKSWSFKKQLEMNGQPHQQKPDIDNYLKAFMDALCEDDSYVYDVRAQKFWSVEGKIIITERGQ